MYDGKVREDRAAIATVMAAGGPATDAAAQKVLNGSPADAHAFLRTGQYQAAERDDRVAIAAIMAAGGPEVDAAAQVALDGPRQMARYFVQAEQYKAAQRDHDTATHVATERGYVAKAANFAALANLDAAKAAETAAHAQKKADEAKGHAARAAKLATEAKKHADDAAASAAEAKSPQTRQLNPPKRHASPPPPRKISSRRNAIRFLGYCVCRAGKLFRGQSRQLSCRGSPVCAGRW